MPNIKKEEADAIAALAATTWYNELPDLLRPLVLRYVCITYHPDEGMTMTDALASGWDFAQGWMTCDAHRNPR